MATGENERASVRRRTVLAAIAVIGVAGAPGAGAIAAPLVDLQVVDRETGQTARVWRHGGRLYVAGRPGARYSVRVTNNSPGRVLVVMSVDGVNILTGETAGYGQRGYVFRPYESYDVSGWRKSDTEVAAFTERVHAPHAIAPAAPEARSHSHEDLEESVVTGSESAAAPPPAARAPSAQAARRSERLGTAHGAREWSAVTTVPLKRATSYPQLVRQIEYDSYENLVARGVIPRRPPAPSRPRPFPEDNGYVPDPPYGR